MDARARQELTFDVEMALLAVPRGTWRTLGKGQARWSPADELERQAAAATIVEHLLRSRWKIERPPPAGGDLGHVLRGPGGG
jgi:hypothetical protein